LLENERPAGPLAGGFQRYFISWERPWPFVVPEEYQQYGTKAIVKDLATGAKRFELLEMLGPRPTLCLVIDQGSKFYSATWFMAGSMRLRVLAISDPHHRTWNDVLDAVGASGMKHLIYEFLVVLNLPHGPWSSCVFWGEILEAMDAFLEMADSGDDLFLSLYSKIAADFGQACWGCM
jgi:hypothetical protein